MSARRALLAAWAFVALMATPGLAAGPVIFNTGEWPPYSSESLPGGGCATELVAAVCEEAGVTPEFVFLPWGRAEAGVRAGQAFAAFPYLFTRQRLAEYDVSDPLFLGVTAVLYRADNPRVSAVGTANPSLRDMASLAFCTLLGSHQATTLEAAGIRPEQVPLITQALEMLRSDRVDCVVAELDVLLYHLRAYYPDDEGFRFMRSEDFSKQSGGLIVSRSSPGAREVLRRFNEALARVRQSGRYEAIMKRWGLEQVP